MEYINLNHLKAFYHVARFKSYSKAATHLFIQQPALSKTVKALEVELGVQLFQKMGRGIELTRSGDYIYSRCEEIFLQVDMIAHFARDEDVPLKQSVNIVCSDLIAAKILPEILSELSSNFPSTRPVLTTGMAQEMMVLMKEKKAGIGLFFHLPKLTSSLKIIKEIAMPFRLVISAHEYHSQKVRSSFIGSREVDDNKSLKFPTVDKMRKHWPQTQIRYSTNNLLTHKEMVLQGMGVSILPYFFVKDEIGSGQLRCLLEEENFSFKLKVVGSAKSELGAYEAALLKRLGDPAIFS